MLAIILGVLIIFGVLEHQFHIRNLQKLDIRVHVNGTRGKSSVTRLIAAGLRAGKIATCAKTTGSRPRMIIEDGSEYSIQRQGRANIIEQVRAVTLATRRKAKALVVECMALNPIYQFFCEQTILKSTVGVITNARADHLDIMGPTVIDVAKALAGITPKKATLVTGETNPEILAIFQKACVHEQSELVVTNPKSECVTSEIMQKFTYVEHPENVAIALRVCKLCGVDAKVALCGMYAAEPDIGVLRIVHLAFYDKEVEFINAFAANDPDSTLAIWNLVLTLFPSKQSRIVVLNCRDDRPQRSRQLGEVLPLFTMLDRVIITGSGIRMAMEGALENGLESESIVLMEQARADEVFECSLAQIGKTGLIFGIGNMGGGGSKIVEYFQNRAIVSQEKHLGE